jgi:hypothetical protein
MIDYEGVSYYHINKAIGIILGVVKHGKVSGYYLRACPRYCEDWEAMGPIILQYGICLTSPTVGTKSKQWSASWNEDGGRWSSGDIVAGHENPLRAAAIVFLKMMESKK